MKIREYLKVNTLLFDGGMGTYYALRNRAGQQECEQANLTAPQEVEAIHRAYRRAGCQALKTNTYGANRQNYTAEECTAILRAGYEIAQCAADGAYVFADIGPIDARDDTDILAEYRFVADRFLELGAKHFLLETLSTDQHLAQLAAYIKEAAPEAFLLVSFGVQPDGFTRDGRMISELLDAVENIPEIDAIGMNCVSGARQMAGLYEKLRRYHKPFSVMPVAGYPTVRGNRTYYDGDPGYFGAQMAALRDAGVQILGGCCGTTPEHMNAVAKALRQGSAKLVHRPSVSSAPATEPPEDPFWTTLSGAERRPIAVELDPPEGADVSKFMAGAKVLQECGTDIITVADCPVARARIDSSLMACKLRRELGMNALPHMTCRDRNLNATQALLLGLCAEGVRNVLLVTGDPIPAASRDEVKSVYNFNSRKLIKYVDGLNQSVLPQPFHIYGALNVNARNFGIQLEMAQKKEENGAEAFLTQPILTAQALDNLFLAREKLQGKLLGGIMPVVSQRNALFMNSEIAGITVDEKIIQLYEGKNREEGEDLAVEISTEVARRMAETVDGFYIITPFGRAQLVARIIQQIRQNGLDR